LNISPLIEEVAMYKKVKKNILIVMNADKGENNLNAWVKENTTFNLSFVSTDERAIELFNRQTFDMVIVDGMDEDIAFKKINAILPIFQKETLLINYEGESSAQLNEKVKLAFEKRKTKRVLRLLILDSTKKQESNGITPFSAN
jgi:hypothetical protein